MGLLELLFEKSNPGPIGEMSAHGKKPEEPKRGELMFKWIVSIAIIGLVFKSTVSSSGAAIGFIIILTIYCFAGYLIMPKPDYSNMGWAGGLLDNPFRFSDDINRMLFGLKVLLYPGRFVAVTLVQTFLLIKKAYK
jgi:hypothetical protein